MNEQKTWHEMVSGSLPWQKVIQKRKFYELCVDTRRQQVELYSSAFSRWRLNMTDPNYLTPLRGQVLDCLTTLNSAYKYVAGLDWLGEENDIKRVLGIELTPADLFGWNVLTDTVVGSVNSYNNLRDAMISAPASICRFLEFSGQEAMKFGIVFEGENFRAGEVMRIALPCDQGSWLSVMASVIGEYRSFAGGAAEGFIENTIGKQFNYWYNGIKSNYVEPLAYNSNFEYTTVMTNAIEGMLTAVTAGWTYTTNVVAYCEWFLKYYSLLDSFYTAMASALNSDMSESSVKKFARNWILSNIRNNCLWGNRPSKILSQFNSNIGMDLISVND